MGTYAIQGTGVVVAWAAIVSVAAWVHGSQETSPQQPAPQQSTPVFRSGVDLVRLDVRITDREGNPINDIRPEEIQITDAGEHRPVLLFQHIAESGRSYAESAARTVSAEVSTNQAPRGQRMPLFDQRTSPPALSSSSDRPQSDSSAGTCGRRIVSPSTVCLNRARRWPSHQTSTRPSSKAVIVHGELERMVTTATGDMTVSEAYRIAR